MVYLLLHLHPKLPSFVGQPTIPLSNDLKKIHSGQSYFFGEYAIGKLGRICLSVMVFETNYGWKIIFLLGRPYFQGLCKKLSGSTPRKTNMEHTNHPFRKEHDLPNLHDCVLC